MSRYRPISDYGVIGNLQTAALIARDGALDWLCLPHFDSPSVFAALLDADKGGSFQIVPAVPFRTEQSYEAFSNVLVTRFVTATGGVELVDFMPPSTEPARDAVFHPELYRCLRGLWGEVPLRLACDPRPAYARVRPSVEVTDRGAVFRGGGALLALAADLSFRRGEHAVTAEFTVSHGAERWLALRHCSHGGCAVDLLAPAALGGTVRCRDTLDFWRRWVDRCRYRGRWREAVTRSALLLKLLTFGPTGALVAAPTTSLPGRPGAPPRDARHCSLRHSVLALNALLSLGYTDEARAFFEWLEARSLEARGRLQAVYGINGRQELLEEQLLHLEGYRGARPVRIGASGRAQLAPDVYGEVLSVFSTLTRRGEKLRGRIWTALRRLVDDLAERWREPDAGFWERGDAPQHHVYSKLMAWVALDRAITLLDPLGQDTSVFVSIREGVRGFLLRERPVVERWTAVKEAIARDILLHGWNSRRGTFTQSYGSERLDASLLRLPACQFLPAEDERVLATIERIREELTVDGLVYPDRPASGAPEFASALGSFWLVSALAAVGRRREAGEMFEAALGRANHLGLYSEQIDPGSGEFAGNFPHVLTHLGLVESALALDGRQDA